MNQRILKRIITQALEEDRADKDITTLSLIPRGHRVAADIVAKENGVICGLDIAKKIFKKIDPRINVRILVRDGKRLNVEHASCPCMGSRKLFYPLNGQL